MVKRMTVPLVISALVAGTLAGLGALYAQSQSSINRVALASEPRGVTAVAVEPTRYRPTRRYVGTLLPWMTARLGPQVISAYVDDVRVRPGAIVRKGELLASLDCRKASAASRTVAMQTRALEARQKAVSGEADRVKKLLAGGFVSENEVEQKQAQSAAEQAQLLSLQSQLTSKALEADDCSLRAPFDGEVSERTADPGTFARPGAPILTVIDRRTVRLAIDVPETDHDAVAPGTAVQISLLAVRSRITGQVIRRSPGADSGTRTIHAEIDLDDPERRLPVGTTAEVLVEVGEAVDALDIPVAAAKVRGTRASLFILDGDIARAVTAEVLGEAGGSLFLRPTLPPGARVVTEGRALLADGEHVAATIIPRQTSAASGSAPHPPASGSAPRPPASGSASARPPASGSAVPPPLLPPVPPARPFPRPQPRPIPAPGPR